MVRQHRHNRVPPRLLSPPAQDGLPSCRPRTAAWARRLLTATIPLLAPPAWALGDQHATITGGADTSGQNYEWTVTHDYSSPIVLIEFPHRMGNIFLTPDGWTQTMTNLRADRPGMCRAESAEGLPAGHSAVFTLRLDPRGSPRGEKEVIVHFADGTRELVWAEVPVRESFLAQHAPLLGLGVVFAFLLLLNRARKGRKPPATSAHEK